MPLLPREREQQRLVAGEVVEHAGEEAPVARGLADSLRADAGGGEKAAELLRLGGEEGQRRNRQRLGRLAPGAAAFCRGICRPSWPQSSWSKP